jgi:type IV secretory pathway VirB3-like protein
MFIGPWKFKYRCPYANTRTITQILQTKQNLILQSPHPSLKAEKNTNTQHNNNGLQSNFHHTLFHILNTPSQRRQKITENDLWKCTLFAILTRQESVFSITSEYKNLPSRQTLFIYWLTYSPIYLFKILISVVINNTWKILNRMADKILLVLGFISFKNVSQVRSQRLKIPPK